MTATHTHDDQALTIGCPACIAQVRAAQEAERWATAPLRLTHWVWVAPVEDADGTFDVAMRVPDGVNPDELSGCAGRQVPAVTDAINATNAPMHAYWYCAEIGAVVAETPAPAVEHPSLFGGAA